MKICRARRYGSAFVEMCLCFSVLMVMVFGAMLFARVFYVGVAVNAAA